MEAITREESNGCSHHCEDPKSNKLNISKYFVSLIVVIEFPMGQRINFIIIIGLSTTTQWAHSPSEGSCCVIRTICILEARQNSM
jgi:hypothetical protein